VELLLRFEHILTYSAKRAYPILGKLIERNCFGGVIVDVSANCANVFHNFFV